MPDFFTVSQVTNRISQLIDSDKALKGVRVRGEISGWSVREPHIYFGLKDDKAYISCVYFGMGPYVKDIYDDGMLVDVEGDIRVYAKRGVYQLYVKRMQKKSTVGELYERFEILKRRLEAEGIFAAERKLPIPSMPKNIGVITSRDAAAFQDILKSLRERGSGARVYLFHTSVQGERAKYEIANAIRRANVYGNLDVLIVARGGGSIEDLWPFNEEIVVKAIASSKIPVVTGIGHETDITLSDLVADKRCHTPTEAAECVTPKRTELIGMLDMKMNAINNVMEQRIAALEQYIDGLFDKIRRFDPMLTLKHRQEILNEHMRRLEKAIVNVLSMKGNLVSTYSFRLTSASPYHRLSTVETTITYLKNRLIKAMDNGLKKRIGLMEKVEMELEALKPGNVMKRGYALVRDSSGRIISTVRAVQVGEIVNVGFYDGHFDSEVKEKWYDREEVL